MTDQELRRCYELGDTPLRCAACWVPEEKTWYYRYPPGLQMAHIVSKGRAGKGGQTIQNVLWLCSLCHSSHHGNNPIHGDRRWPEVSGDMLLFLKDELGEFDPEALAEAAGWQVSYIHERRQAGVVPGELMQERGRWIVPGGIVR